MQLPRPLRRTTDLGRSAAILVRRGLVRPLRPGDSLRALRVARRAGPFAAMIAATARSAPDTPAVVDERRTLTYGELDRLGNAVARGLAGLGVRAGGVAGLLGRDSAGLVLALVAAGKLGVRVALLNPGLAGPALADVVRRERVTALLLDAELLPLVTGLPVDLPRVLLDLPAAAAVTLDDLAAGHSAAPLPPPVRPGGLVLLTSGTTGVPRGTPRDRMSPLQSAQLLDRIPLTRGGTTVLGTPLFHGTGLGQAVLAMALGRTLVLRGRFDPAATLAAVAAHRADTLVVVPTMLKRILDLGPDELARHDTSSLRVVVSGGSALPPELCRRTAAAFGEVLHNVYGSTEVANASVATPAELRRAPGTIGRPPVGCRVALYDERRRPVTAAGVTGAIFASTGLAFTGYTDGGGKEVVDGLLHTGDVGHRDGAGLLFVDGRDDEMIVSGGENVFPAEVEQLLAGRADVRDAAVVGVPDPDFGQRLRAYVVAAPGAALDPAELQAYVKASLARHKVPREVVFVADLPRNATGKLVRSELPAGPPPGSTPTS